ncbi:uncharacterized protein LOC127253028 [Andrographis paniculata]|uniref:uncharacterized protein LOC127253028 n=1 Tax=Andrographis paniculata TaxID=175694 RepID=UPI0021E79424|nr:uncharacterized protein LOC127253028 [Andrographis paniculata]
MATTSRHKGVLDRKNSSIVFIHINPPHGWKDDSQFHYLYLTLPGFETNNITIHMDKYGYLVVRGDRQVSEHKYISFEETFDIPNDADLEEASGQFEDDQIYCVTIPKKKQQLEQQQQHQRKQRREHREKPTVPIEKMRSKSFSPTRYDSLITHPSHQKKFSLYRYITSCCRRCGCM